MSISEDEPSEGAKDFDDETLSKSSIIVIAAKNKRTVAPIEETDRHLLHWTMTVGAVPTAGLMVWGHCYSFGSWIYLPVNNWSAAGIGGNRESGLLLYYDCSHW